MIKVDIFEAREDFTYQKNGTFTKGNLYYGRMSKDGNSYVAKSNEGYWVPVIMFTWAKSGKAQFLERIHDPDVNVILSSYKIMNRMLNY